MRKNKPINEPLLRLCKSLERAGHTIRISTDKFNDILYCVCTEKNSERKAVFGFGTVPMRFYLRGKLPTISRQLLDVPSSERFRLPFTMCDVEEYFTETAETHDFATVTTEEYSLLIDKDYGET